MNIVLRRVVGMLVCATALFSQTIDEQIKAITQASPQERVRLMNQLKTQLATMNQEKRAEAIRSLQRETGAQSGAQMQVNEGYRVMQHSQAGEQNHQQLMIRLHDGVGSNAQRQHGRP